MSFHYSAPGLDDLLFDVVTVIELSDHDRQVADNRYRKLQPHLERPSSRLRDLLLDKTCLIYAQGSMSIGATIISGAEDEDRFDVDALVDVPVPSYWSQRRSSRPALRLAPRLPTFARSCAAPVAFRCNSPSCTWT